MTSAAYLLGKIAHSAIAATTVASDSATAVMPMTLTTRFPITLVYDDIYFAMQKQN